MSRLVKFIKYFLFLSFILVPLNVKAEDCKYEVDASYADGEKKISCHSNYRDALNAMNNYKSTDKDVAIIKNNGTIINAKYAIAKIDVENGGEIHYNTDGVIKVYRSSYSPYYDNASNRDPEYLTYIATTWGSDAAFLNYDPDFNTVNIKISGVNGWINKNHVNIIPISKYYGSTYNYSSNKPTLKTLKSGIALRKDHSTSSSYLNTISDNITIEYYPSQTYIANDYIWYKVNYKGTVGWIASDKNDPWAIDNSVFRNDTYYYSNNNILYHHIHKGALESDVNMTLGTAPYVYLKEKVKTFYLSNSDYSDIDANIRYFSFDSNYFYNSYTSMIDDYRNNNYNNAINKDYPHYPYFMYLPSRSITGYTADSFNQMVINKGFTGFPINPKNYVDPSIGSFKNGYSAGNKSMMFGIGASIIKAQNKYGSNAMNIFSNALRESGTGTSAIAFYKNNLFGMGAADGNAFNGAYTYNSVEDSVMDYVEKLSYDSAYSNLYDYRYNGTHEGNKLNGKGVQYASDPYSGESNTGLSFWSDYNNGKIDEFKNTIGITNNLVNIYAEPSTSSRLIYQTKNYINNRTLPNMPFVITDYVENNGQGFYKVYTDVTLNSERRYDIDTYYDFNNCYGYIRKEDIYVHNHQPVINVNDVTIGQFDTFKSTATASDFENGDLTSRLSMSGNVNTKEPGVYKVTYNVIDNENFSSTKTINVTVDASNEPIFTLENVNVSQFTEYDPLTNVKAVDRKDGDLTSKIEIIEGKLDTNVQGDYKIKYQVKDSDNNITTAERTITVIPNEMPVITANNIVTYLNQPLNVMNNVKATDKEDGDLTSKITYKGDVVNDKIGSFEVTYSVIDSAKQTTTKTITVTVEEKKYIQKNNIFQLETLSYNKNTSKLDIVGFLIIKGMNNLISTVIKYDIIFQNQFNGNETIMPLNRLTKNIPYDAPGDSGFTNTGSWFSGNVDLKDLDSGDYTVYIRARSGDYETKTVIKNPFFNTKFERKFVIGNSGYLFKSNYYNKLIPLELYVRKDGQITNTNNPTIDNMYNQVYDISLNEDKLNIQASSHNVKGNYAENQTVLREVYLENLETKKIAKKYNVGSITNGPYAISLKVSDGYSKTRAWYKSTLDLSDVAPGKYAIIVRTKSGTIDDHGELYDILFKNIAQSSTKSGRKYYISRNDSIRYRIELKIEG